MDDWKSTESMSSFLLMGELPSFGMAKQSKLQPLMQRHFTPDSHGVQPNQALSDMQRYNEFDATLSVEAKAFQPSSGNPFGTQPSMAHSSAFSNTISSFENMGINTDMTAKSMFTSRIQPNPAANEFIPRNMSAPSLDRSQRSSRFALPEFIPNRSNNGNNIPQQHHISMAPTNPQTNQMLMRGNNSAFPDTSTPRLPHAADNIMSPMIDYSSVSGLPMASSGTGTAHDSQISSSVSFPASQSQLQSSGYFSGDNGGTPFTAGSRGFSTPGVSAPFPGQSMSSISTNASNSERLSPLLTRRLMNHRGSPLSSTGMNISLNSTQSSSGLMQQPMAHENGGTTYFYTQKETEPTLSVVMPPFHVFPGSPPNIEYMNSKPTAPSFFMPSEIREAMHQKHALTMLTVDTEQDPSIPAEVDNYHSLFPLEAAPENPLKKSSTFGFVTSCYKAIKYKDGLAYCLRRIHGFRQVNEKCMTLVDMWKKIQHPNIVQLREVFTSKAFGEHSLIFSHDYYPGAETLMARHFQNPNNNYASKAKWNGGTARQNAGLLPERLIWAYIVQLTSALRCIHTAGLACRVLDPTKIIVSDKCRLRINGVGIFDVLLYDNSHGNPLAHMQQYQQEDLMALGKVILALSCNSVTSIQRDNLHKSIELVVMNYSTDLKNLILYLLSPQQRPLSVNEVMPMIGARFYTQIENAVMRGDVIENELSKELENGRLFRLLCKLGTINERSEFGMEPTWSETGDRYLLKLFRDHLFHQVTDTGAPWIDLPHIVQCLNKLDAGVPEKICLMSRDEQNVLVVSYSELKKAFAKCFDELKRASSGL